MNIIIQEFIVVYVFAFLATGLSFGAYMYTSDTIKSLGKILNLLALIAWIVLVFYYGIIFLVLSEWSKWIWILEIKFLLGLIVALILLLKRNRVCHRE